MARGTVAVQREPDSSDESESSIEDEGQLLTEEQELGMAEVLLAVKSGEYDKAAELAQKIPQELNSIPKTDEQKAPKLTLKQMQWQEIESGVYAEDSRYEEVEKDLNRETPLTSNSLTIDDEDETDAGLVESVGQTAKSDTAAERKAERLFASAIGKDSDNDKFLRKFFEKRMWQSDTKQGAEALFQFTAASQRDPADDAADDGVIVRELNDDLEQMWAADDHEATFNMRHERDAAIGGFGSDNAFAVIKKPSARALQAKNRKERDRADTEQRKAQLVADLTEDKEAPPSISRDDFLLDSQYPDDQEWFLCDGCSEPVLPGKVMFVCPDCPDYALCKTCQKNKIRHEHPLLRSKCPADAHPPRTWKLSVEALKEDKASFQPHDVAVSTGRALAAKILSELTFVPDGTFKYVESDPREEKLTYKRLFALAETAADDFIETKMRKKRGWEPAEETASKSHRNKDSKKQGEKESRSDKKQRKNKQQREEEPRARKPKLDPSEAPQASGPADDEAKHEAAVEAKRVASREASDEALRATTPADDEAKRETKREAKREAKRVAKEEAKREFKAHSKSHSERESKREKKRHDKLKSSSAKSKPVEEVS